MSQRTPQAERFTNIRTRTGLSQAKFAMTLNEKTHRIRDIELSKQEIPIDIVEKMEEIYHINRNWLLTGEGEPYNELPLKSSVDLNRYIETKKESIKTIELPYYPSGVPCGNVQFFYDNYTEKIILPYDYARDVDFVIRASGESMKNKGIMNNSKLLVKNQQYLSANGDVMILNIKDNGVVCREVKIDYEKKIYILEAFNDDYEPLEIEIGNVNFIGKVVRIITDI